MTDEIKFAEGIYFDQPRESAPAYVLGQISMRREQAIQWLESLDTEWVRVDVQMSKGGKPYCKLNTYQKGQNATQARPKAEPTVDAETGQQRTATPQPAAKKTPRVGASASDEGIEYPQDDINPDDIPF